MDALTKAYEIRKPEAGLICHSDRGSQYCSHEYQQLLKDYTICCSMSRKAQCLDNACAETFFHSMKVEWFYGKPLQSKYFTQKSIIEYTSVFYNRQRLHSTLGYLPPCQFEANYYFSRFHLSAWAWPDQTSGAPYNDAPLSFNSYNRLFSIHKSDYLQLPY